MNRLIDISSLRVEDLCCLVLDEAHETKGNSPYARLMKKVRDEHIDISLRPLILAMSASPLDTVEKHASDASIGQKLMDLAERLGCNPCYPRENDPYDNGISHTTDWAIPVPNSEKELEFKRELDNYLRSIVNHVKDRLSTVASKFNDLAVLVQEDLTVDTNRFRGMLRDIEKELDAKRDSDVHRNHHADVYYGSVSCLFLWG